MSVEGNEYDAISELTMGALERYVDHRIPPGSFLRAVLCNDLFDAVARADLNNQYVLPLIVKYIYNELPGGCWGNAAIVDSWLEGDND